MFYIVGMPTYTGAEEAGKAAQKQSVVTQYTGSDTVLCFLEDLSTANDEVLASDGWSTVDVPTVFLSDHFYVWNLVVGDGDTYYQCGDVKVLEKDFSKLLEGDFKLTSPG